MTDTGHDRPDDTVGSRRDTSLADDLLDRDDTSDAVRGGGEWQDELREVEPDQDEQDAQRGDDDDDYFEPHPQRRSRVTTGLLVALIFVLGMLCGVLAGRVLTPTPPPQIVYLLGDSTTSTPSPSASAPPASTPSAGR